MQTTEEIQKIEMEAKRREWICIDDSVHIFRTLEVIPGRNGSVEYAFYCQKCLVIKQRRKVKEQSSKVQ